MVRQPNQDPIGLLYLRDSLPQFRAQLVDRSLNGVETLVDPIQMALQMGNPLRQSHESDRGRNCCQTDAKTNPGDRPQRCQFNNRHGPLGSPGACQNAAIKTAVHRYRIPENLLLASSLRPRRSPTS